ncbi:hypothetical protein GCM10022240_06270 [Microbacterium kribbense]|uniref:Uncharacterized protein n=1 Tax=Microbacterium kribbense TaxID=433645 RepID=A0ABP7G4I5_9MICO
MTYRVTADPDTCMRIEHSTQTKGDYGHTHHHDAIIYINPRIPARRATSHPLA